MKVRITYTYADYKAARLFALMHYRNEQGDGWTNKTIPDTEPSDDFNVACEVKEEATVWYGSANLCCCKSCRRVVVSNECDSHATKP